MVRFRSISLRAFVIGLSLVVLSDGSSRRRTQARGRTSYFNSGVMGQPIHWASGQVSYYVDRGPLSVTVTQPAGYGHG